MSHVHAAWSNYRCVSTSVQSCRYRPHCRSALLARHYLINDVWQVICCAVSRSDHEHDDECATERTQAGHAVDGGVDRRRARPGCRGGRGCIGSRPDGFGSGCAADRRLALQRRRPDRCPQPVDPGIHRAGCERRHHRHRRVAGRRSQRGRQGGGDGRSLGRVGRSGNPVPRHLRPRHAHGRHHRRARPGGEPCACRCASRVVPRSGTWRRHRVGEGGWAHWCGRCVAGDRRYRLGGAACRPTEHPRAQPVVRNRLDPAVHHRPVGVRGGAGVEGRHRGGDGCRERR